MLRQYSSKHGFSEFDHWYWWSVGPPTKQEAELLA